MPRRESDSLPQLKLLTRSLISPVDQAAPADQDAGEADEAVVDVQASFPAHGEAAELVEQGEGLLDDVTQPAQAFHAGGLGLGDDWFGTAFAAGPPEGFAAVGLVSQQCGEAAPGPAWPAGDRWIAVEQVESTLDVGDVGAAGQYIDRGAVAVADQVMLGAGFAAVDRRRACSGTPFFASM